MMRDKSGRDNKTLGPHSATVAVGRSRREINGTPLPLLGLSAKGERAIPGECSGASSSNIHSFIGVNHALAILQTRGHAHRMVTARRS